ncbi:GIY-YIG nuclease family protein [Bacillaceae bacterium S4-13-58]
MENPYYTKNPLDTQEILEKLKVPRSELRGKMPGVYKITCLENGKIYIGKSKKNVYKRIIENLKSIARYELYNEELHKDLLCFFPHKFEIEVVAFCPDSSVVSDIEEILISKEFSLNPERLYNQNSYCNKWRILKNLKQSELSKLNKLF